MEKLEDTILRNLLFDEDYTRKTLPFFRDEYFTTFSDRLIFEEIRKYFDKYTKQPSIEALGIELNGRQIYDDAQLEIDKINEEMLRSYEIPPLDMIA